MKKGLVFLFLVYVVQCRALAVQTKEVEAENFNTPNQSHLNVTQEKPTENVQLNDSQTNTGEDRLPHSPFVTELELEKTGSLRDAVDAKKIDTFPIYHVYQPPGPPERNSNHKGSYIATVSYGPNSPSLIYTCYSNNEADPSILNLSNAVQGPYGYVCTVVKGRPGVVTEVVTVQEPPPPVIPGAVELPAEVETPLQASTSSPTTLSTNAVNATHGNVYYNPQVAQTQNPQNYYQIKAN